MVDCEALAKQAVEAFKSDGLRLLELQNKCLLSNNKILVSQVEIQAKKLDELANKHLAMNAKLEASLSSYKDRVSELTTSHGIVLDTQREMFEASLASYEHWTIGLSVIIALAGAASFFLIRKYKKREIQEIIDDVKEKVNKEVDDGEVLRRIISPIVEASLKSKANELSSMVFEEIRPTVRSAIDDELGSDRQGLKDELADILQQKEEETA